MPYPLETPTAKHDLLTPPLPASGLPFDEVWRFQDTSELFQALKSEIPHNLRPLASVYTYPDAPAPALSRNLLVLGVCDSSLSVVQKVEELSLDRCTVAVKRADGRFAKELNPKQIEQSHAFAAFLRQLHAEGSVAILAPDKYKRFGILRPTEDILGEGNFAAQEFAAELYVGRVENVTEVIGQGKRPTAASVTTSEDTESGFWKPPGAMDDKGEDSGFWQPPSGTSNSDSFSFEPSNLVAGASSSWEDTTKKEDAFHGDAGAEAANKFYSGLKRELDTRVDSRIFHMRAFNGWVKATQIQELDPKTSPKKSPLRVLDLACGKGGDLGKWTLHKRGIGNYVGIDVARGSLVDAAIRARRMRKQLKLCAFTCADLGADVPGRLKSPKYKYLQKLSTWSLQREAGMTMTDPEFKMIRGGGVSPDDKFDVVSIQFAIHYMMQTKKRARRFFQTISELLEIGGNLVATTIDARVVVEHLMNMGLDLHFDDATRVQEPAVVAVGGGACRIRFEPEVVRRIFTTSETNSGGDLNDDLFGLEYTFTLVEGSDHAAGVGDAVNLPEWLIPIPVLQALGREAGLELEYAQNFHEFFSHRSDPFVHASAHSSLYNMKVLNRNGSISPEEFEISRLYVALKFRKVRESTMNLDDFAEEMEEEEQEIDPATKAKFLPMALMKAKKAAGNEVWATLSSEEKNALTEAELRKLASKPT